MMRNIMRKLMNYLFYGALFIQVARFESRVNPTDIPMTTMSNSNGSTMQINSRPDDIRKRIIGCKFFATKTTTKLKYEKRINMLNLL